LNIHDLTNKSDFLRCAVPSPTLVSHFKTLSELKSEFHNRYAQLSEQLKELEKINCFNEVDSIIMEKEISNLSIRDGLYCLYLYFLTLNIHDLTNKSDFLLQGLLEILNIFSHN
jgi:hypothetical protein